MLLYFFANFNLQLFFNLLFVNFFFFFLSAKDIVGNWLSSFISQLLFIKRETIEEQRSRS